MIFNKEQLVSLEDNITDLLESEGVEVTGLEVTSVDTSGRGYRAYFRYEDSKSRDCRDHIYFSACLESDRITDFEEFV